MAYVFWIQGTCSLIYFSYEVEDGYLKKQGTLYDHLYEAEKQAEEYIIKAQEEPQIFAYS
jgi:hypothetical protein